MAARATRSVSTAGRGGRKATSGAKKTTAKKAAKKTATKAAKKTTAKKAVKRGTFELGPRSRSSSNPAPAVVKALARGTRKTTVAKNSTATKATKAPAKKVAKKAAKKAAKRTR